MAFSRRLEPVMSTRITVVAPAPAMSVPATGLGQPRLDSVDWLRGVVMVLMALDHVRDFFSDRLFADPTDLATTTPALFLTRWVTHFCAPTFIFLAGTGAFLAGTRGKSRGELAWFLFTRGLWLVVLELTVNRVGWMFNFDPYHHGPGVFWAIGWSMVVLAGLVFLPIAVVTAFGVVMISAHNWLDGLTASQVGLPEWLWVVLHRPGEAPVMDGIMIGTGYCLVPWMGVMAAGYGFGTVLLLEPSVRRRCCCWIGIGLTLTFVGLRAINVYGDPRPWSVQGDAVTTVLSFLNCTKYPASLLYLLMTLGPAIFALGHFDRPPGPLAKPLVTFGRVPLFFYVLHVPLVHAGAVLCDYLRFGWSPQATNGPWAVRPGEVPESYGVSLPDVYLLWVAVVVALYPACRWFAEVKRRHRSAWLSYL
jgi:uncharacterized membrane protein